jgi:ABC-type branched-subunit amino acid transport system substrate-binding protein
MRRELAERGVRFMEERILPQDTDFRPAVSRMRKRNVRCVGLLLFHPQAAHFLSQAKEQGLSFQFAIGINSLRNAGFFELGGDAVDGVYIANRQVDRSHASFEKLRGQYGQELPGALADAYDALTLAATAYVSCNAYSGAECVKKRLAGMRDVSTLSGRKSFDVNGDMTDRYELFRANWKNRTFALAEDEPG